MIKTKQTKAAPLAPGAVEAETPSTPRAAAQAAPASEHPQGLAPTRLKAVAAAVEAFAVDGVVDPEAYAVRKTARGDWWWGPSSAPEAQPAPGRSAKGDIARTKATKAAPKAASAKPTPKAKSAAKAPAKKAKAAEVTISDKAATAIKMLQRKNGATAADIAERNDWLAHTTRAWIATFPKKLGLKITKSKEPGEATVYKIAE